MTIAGVRGKAGALYTPNAGSTPATGFVINFPTLLPALRYSSKLGGGHRGFDSHQGGQ